MPSPLSTTAVAPSAAEPFDEIVDLTDRRRVLLGIVFGVTVSPAAADHVFATPPACAGAVSPRR